MAQNGINFKKSIFTASGLFLSISKAKKRNMSRVKSLEELFFPIKQRFRKDTTPSNIIPCLRTAINNNKKLIGDQCLKHKGIMSFSNTQTAADRQGVQIPRFWLFASYKQLIKFLGEDFVLQHSCAPSSGTHWLSALTFGVRQSQAHASSHRASSERNQSPSFPYTAISYFFTFSLCTLLLVIMLCWVIQ